MNINRKTLPIKAHFFFFMAAMGPIFPFLSIFAKQLGISPLIFGSITAILPITYLIVKPSFGFIVDHFYQRRKCIFIILLVFTPICFAFLYSLPHFFGFTAPEKQFLNVTIGSFNDYSSLNITSVNKTMKNVDCDWMCGKNHFVVPMTFFDVGLDTLENPYFKDYNATGLIHNKYTCDVTCSIFEETDQLYNSPKFWVFVLLMAFGCIGFNVSNCIGDAICFDILGEGGQMEYGRQRVFGTIGYGISALLAGLVINKLSEGQQFMEVIPALAITFVFSIIDILCCKRLELPQMRSSGNLIKDVCELIRLKQIAVFLIFAVIPGIMDSFVIYFLFWYMEDLARETGYLESISIIQGVTVSAQTLAGEVIFFILSGKILKTIGFGYTFTLCFMLYGLRFGLNSIAPTPLWMMLVELFLHGPTYALSYTTIASYASTVSPPGTSASVQGIIVGMDDGLGFSIGSLIGGILYKNYGGVMTLRIFSFIAILTSITYLGLYLSYLKHLMPGTDATKSLEYNTPTQVQKDPTEDVLENSF